MSLSDKMATLLNELSQRQKAQMARAALQNLRSVIIETNLKIQEIADSGDFDTLDVDIKSALISGWDIAKATELAFEDVIVAELLNWKP